MEHGTDISWEGAELRTTAVDGRSPVVKEGGGMQYGKVHRMIRKD
jgi:hypothetical protein